MATGDFVTTVLGRKSDGNLRYHHGTFTATSGIAIVHTGDIDHGLANVWFALVQACGASGSNHIITIDETFPTTNKLTIDYTSGVSTGIWAAWGTV